MDERVSELLVAVAGTARACAPAFVVRAEADAVMIEPASEEGFAVNVRVEGEAIVVDLGRWSRRFAREVDPDEDADALALAHDLVAAALWGRARVRTEWLGDEPWRTTVCFGAPGRWLTFERVGGGLRAPWRRLRLQTSINVGVPPTPIDERALRPLPWAPWAGMRGDRGQEPEPVELVVDGELDLHSFRPKEVRPLVLEYIVQCRQRGILELRIVHGKGIGNLRRTVHALLDRHEAVKGYRLGGQGGGGWGATVVDLHPLGPIDAER